MEVQAFKIRVSQDNKVRDSFAPEYHLRQNSNNTTRLNDEGNDSGINDHLTSARFNFPEEIEDQNGNNQNQINNENQNLPIIQQQNFQLQKQQQQHFTAYQKKNVELSDYSSNGKHNLNSNGNYNTQRTNQSNQTLSESNTVVKEKQPEELLANEEEEYDEEHFQNGNQLANQFDKYQQQSHYNQLVLHHQQIQQKQLYQKQNVHLNGNAQQKRLLYDVQNNQHQEEDLDQQYLHNQSQNSMNQVDIEFLGEDNQVIAQPSNSGFQRQMPHQQNQGNYQNPLLQKQQQNIINQQVNRQINNKSMQQSFGIFNQFDQNQQQQQLQKIKNVYQQSNGGQFFSNNGVDDGEEYDYESGHLQDYNDHYVKNNQYLSNLQQKQQIYTNPQQLQYNQKVYQQYPAQQIKHSNQILNQQKQQQQTALQQLKQQNQDHSNYGSQSLNAKMQSGQATNNYIHKRNASQLNYTQKQCHTYSDDEVLTLTHGEDDDRHIYLEDNQEQIQNQLNNSGNHNNNNQLNLSGFNGQSSYQACYPLPNSNLQKIDKQTIDEHSNNTSNNEEGIVNISSIKKNVITHQNTPSHTNYQAQTSPIPLKESNNNQQSNIKNQIESNQGITNYQKNIINSNTNQQSRKNNFNEDKENQTPHNSLSVKQRENSANLQKGYGNSNKHQANLSPISITPYNQSLQNSCNQSYIKVDKEDKVKLNNQKQKLDISADENIQDTSYSMFLPGANYLDEEIYLQSTSVAKQSSKNWKNNQNVSQKQYQKNQLQNPIMNQDGAQRFTEEQLDCSQLNIKDLQDGYYYEGQDKLNGYYLDEQSRNIQLAKIQNQSLISSKNDTQNNSQLNKKPVTSTAGINKFCQSKNVNKTTNSTSATQSTSVTFQTQGFPRDSIGSKENIYNISNLTSEGKNMNTQENKVKGKLNNQNKLITEGDLEAIEFEQVVEKQNNQNQQNFSENNQRAIQIASVDNRDKQKMKTICSRSSSQESQNEKDSSKLELDKSRNKNEAQEKLIRQKSQMVFDYQKVIEQISKENEQLKQEREEKNITILAQKKYIQELEEQQKNNKEQELNEELIQENQKLNEEYKTLQIEYKEFLDQNIQLINENKQLIKYNNELESSLQELQSKQSVIDSSVQMQFSNQISQLQLQIEKITAAKDQEIEQLKKSIMEISSHNQQNGRKNSIGASQDQQHQIMQQAKKLEKGTSFESMNISSAMTDNSFSQSFNGHPPRKQQNLHKNQQSNVQNSHNNSNHSNNNFNTICSHPSQDESNNCSQSQNQQNYRRTRSSSLSYKGIDQSLQNSYYNQNNNIYSSQSNHQHSGSFSQSNQSMQSQQTHSNATQICGASSQNNQRTNIFSIQELMSLLQLSQEQEILQKVKEIQEYNINTKKFINCIIDMIQKCAPQGYFTNKKPDLKQCWNILKKIMDKYLVLKVNMIKDQVDQELVIKIQSYLQINDKEQIVDKIANLQSENQKLTRIMILVKKTFNLEWAKSLYELEKALENESEQQIAQTSKSFSGIKQDNLPSHSSQVTFNGYSQLSSAHQINSKGSASNLQNLNNHSQLSQMRGVHKKESILNQEHNQIQQHQQQYQIYGSAASSQRIDSANSNHIVHHNLLI
ncbi:hypothetical protein TTHERM_00730350 (macronuclear) [Tetrahymena thermophila SB210]|uniref:Uncharacterized protein n=1 Tax=Tetrahymena thermophila (strain SB210) TaxID=312017 RepID=Q245H8_TETTS|nr:hypothetical protein TTHERM_00730350 [Tetrahymena thermophila SB210]EAS03386.2 hypothetical protein TTHERM_00730350 [Tetrahymena thermophila SB210]|eukprot:XP_001023631.2 hypothetical protein TTHERM_00730350 [Tetrahymena thermophila SB210]